jgi:hypothetical protein
MVRARADLTDILTTWTHALSEEQLEQLRWLRAAKCTIEAQYAPPDPLHSLPEGLVLEALVDRHAVVKLRGTIDEIPEMFDRLYESAKALFEFVNRPEERR